MFFKMFRKFYFMVVLNSVIISSELAIRSLEIDHDNSSSSDMFMSNQDADLEFTDIEATLDSETHNIRRKRYIGTDTIFFKETEYEIRELIGSPISSTIDLKLLPIFGGKDAAQPYVNLIQVLSHSRSYRDGAVDGGLAHTTGDTISVSVDPFLHRFTKGKWAIYAGSRHHRCMPQSIFGNGIKVVFDCFTEGTYYAFFRVDGTYRDENDIVNGHPYLEPDTLRLYFDDNSTFDEYNLDPRKFFIDYEQAILQNPDAVSTPWYYSDPIKIIKNSYCYRWSYRLFKDNEVGFVHLEPNPEAAGGVYREYTLKVWIVDPSEVSQEEINSPLHLKPSRYSQIITRRFFLGGLVPCIRYSHPAIEVVSDAEYVLTDLGGRYGFFDSVTLQGPHWRFKFKVFLDKIVSTLSDIAFTISPRQHSALYDCLISDVRVYIPSKSYAFLSAAKVSSTAINLEYSTISQVERRFLKENVINYYAHEVVYVGPPYLKERNSSSITVFSDPCINQELGVEWKGTVGMTSDFFARNDLEKVILPSFDKTRLGLRPTRLQLSEPEVKAQMERSDNVTYAKDRDLRIGLFDVAFTPVDMIFLTSDSSLIFHSTDLSLRGIGYNTISQKYKLFTLIRRRWCARSSTPKTHNMWVPSFSRDSGHIIIIVQVPLEGAGVITRDPETGSCEGVRNSEVKSSQTKLTEKQIHVDEEDDARIDRVVEAKLRTKSAEQKIKRRNMNRRVIERRTRKDIPIEQKTFWMSGQTIIEDRPDPHYLSGDTDARKVRIADTGLERNNDNVIFIVDLDFGHIRETLEMHGLTFDVDETVYGSGTDRLVRPAANYRLLRYHSIEFTGVEKKYLLAVGFQSAEFPIEIDTINSCLVVICTFSADDLPVVIEPGFIEEYELKDVVIGFTGLVIRRLQTTKYNGTGPYTQNEEDYKDSQGRIASPLPMSPYTTTLNTINTAIPLYVLRINDVILFASLDGSFAKPVLAYEQHPTPNHPVEAKPFLPFDEFDIVVTEQGILSALSRKKYVGNVPVTASEVFVGSVLTNEPLRPLHPFHVSNNVFQVSTETGEIVYGKLSYNAKADSFDGPPKTEVLNIPFWSLLKGSFGRSAGENEIPLGQTSAYSGATTSFADPICPYASFEVFHHSYPYVESDYTTRITAEVAFYGDVIPLEADIIVEFSEVQGVSVEVSSSLEVDHDQTVIRKIIELSTYIPDPILRDMYERHRSQTEEGERILEQVRVFTLTIRPSVLNLHCQNDNYFRTIQVNVGCFPLSKMRLLAEAIPLKKIIVSPWTDEMESTSDFPINTWYVDSSTATNGTSYLVLSKKSIHKSQHNSFDCNYEKYCKIPVPAGRNVEDNVYGLSFRDVMVPKFEQFMTKHARRVTGNVVIYDIMDSFKEDSTQLETNTTQYAAGCVADDGEWYDKMANKANFHLKELSAHSDIYKYYKNCFNHEGLKKLDQIQTLNSRGYYVFNATNKNAIQLKRKRNYIYILRATVVNTENNRYTFCQRLDTFFVLQVVNIAQQQKIIEPFIKYVYLFIIILVAGVLFSVYYYFATRMEWSVVLEPKTIYDQQEEDRVVDELRKRYDSVPTSPYARLAKRIAELEKIQRGAKQYHTSRLEEREERLNPSKRSKSEGDKGRRRPSTASQDPNQLPPTPSPLVEATEDAPARKSGEPAEIRKSSKPSEEPTGKPPVPNSGGRARDSSEGKGSTPSGVPGPKSPSQ